MYVKSARFVISNTNIEKCPNNNLPEYAFIGRSNVGKSSLINSICNTKALAKTSSKPGKTQLINHYLINDKWFLVDLPGYGYANTSKTKKKIFQSLITTYFVKRKQLISAFLLIDTLGFDVTESSHLQILLIPSFRTWCTSQQKLMGTHQLVHFSVLRLIYQRYLFSGNQDCRPRHGI